MNIKGAENLTVEQLCAEMQQGAKIVVFDWCVSVVVLTFKRQGSPVLVRRGESAFFKSLPCTMVSLCFGWWGFPWGFIYTPMAVIKNLSGGTDVTRDFWNEISPLVQSYQSQAIAELAADMNAAGAQRALPAPAGNSQYPGYGQQPHGAQANYGQHYPTPSQPPGHGHSAPSPAGYGQAQHAEAAYAAHAQSYPPAPAANPQVNVFFPDGNSYWGQVVQAAETHTLVSFGERTEWVPNHAIRR